MLALLAVVLLVVVVVTVELALVVPLEDAWLVVAEIDALTIAVVDDDAPPWLSPPLNAPW